MGKLLEIFGRAITVDSADLIWHWLTAQGNKTDFKEAYLCDEFDKVLEALGNMDLDKAQEKLNFYLYENPDSAKGRMAATAICLHRQQIDQAIEQLQSVYVRQPSNTMALYTLGYCYERLGREAEALEFYQDCIKFKSHLQLPRQRMAAIYFKNGRTDKTIEQYEGLITEHPEDVVSMVLLGYLYIEDHQYDRAVDTFNMAIVSHPDNFHDDNESEELRELIDTGQFDAALENVQWLMEKVGDLPDLHVKIADILSCAGRPTEAIVHYENAIRIQPNYLEATIKLGTHYLRFQRYALAAEQFNRAVEINDDIVDAYLGLAAAQNYNGLQDETFRTLSLAGAIQQNSTLLFSETATLHLQAALNERDINEGQPPDKVVLIEDVIRAHQKQMQLTPRSADIHYKFGILMMVAQDADEAIKSFRTALEINPTHHRAHCKLAVCLSEKGNDEQAIEQLTRSQKLSGESLELHYRVAMLYCNKRKFAEALNSLEETMKANFTQPDAMVNIEVVLENLGLIDRAIATWDRLTEAAHHTISERYE